MGDAGALVGEADGVALVEHRHDDLLEPRVDEVLRHLADDRVGDGAARPLRVVEGVGRQRLDVLVGGPGWDLDDARRAAQVAVHRDARSGFHVGEIEGLPRPTCGFLVLA